MTDGNEVYYKYKFNYLGCRRGCETIGGILLKKAGSRGKQSLVLPTLLKFSLNKASFEEEC